MAQTPGAIRGDLIRRLFAVAISVGAASTLAQMKWVTNGTFPNLSEWQQLSILSAAMMATVLSWDGYLVAIEERPLNGFWRFLIDVVLVFIYMFLLMTSHHKTWWLPIHAIIYAFYVIWDFLTVREYTNKYYYKGYRKIKDVQTVYLGGLRDIEGISKGPVITICRGFYFWAGIIYVRDPLTWVQLIPKLPLETGRFGYAERIR